MKKFFICASLFAFVSLGVSAQKIEAINKIVDCGQTTYQSPATAEFEVKNKSNHAVRIVDVRTSCGCTDVDYPKGEIAPDAIITTEVGQNQMWAAQFFVHKDPSKFISSAR